LLASWRSHLQAGVCACKGVPLVPSYAASANAGGDPYEPLPRNETTTFMTNQ
jgi:hypothetical protein